MCLNQEHRPKLQTRLKERAEAVLEKLLAIMTLRARETLRGSISSLEKATGKHHPSQLDEITRCYVRKCILRSSSGEFFLTSLSNEVCARFQYP